MAKIFADPVCGLEINERNVGASLAYNGQMVYFCSVECRDMFMDDPQQYAQNEDEEQYRR